MRLLVTKEQVPGPSQMRRPLAGAAFTASQELTAGTVFKFDIDLDKNYLGTAGAGPCATLSGVGETLQLKMIVDGGGTTISELSIDSVVSGKAVV